MIALTGEVESAQNYLSGFETSMISPNAIAERSNMLDFRDAAYRV